MKTSSQSSDHKVLDPLLKTATTPIRNKEEDPSSDEDDKEITIASGTGHTNKVPSRQEWSNEDPNHEPEKKKDEEYKKIPI
jgi:hypothetical protein